MHVRYRCAGPLLHSPEAQQVLLDPETSIARITSAAEALRLSGQQPDEDEWQFRIRLARARHPCGSDLTEIVQAIPRDGQVHQIVCPRCGTTATVVRA